MESKRLILGLVIIFVALSITASGYAEQSFNLKGGYQDIICEGADGTPVIEVSYEYKYKRVAIEFGVGAISAILHDTQTDIGGRFDWYTGKNMGRLNALNYFATAKLYPLEDVYVGGGIGYYDLYFVENYRVYQPGEQADADDELEYHLVAGWEFNKDWFLETKYIVGDLDLESNISPEGILEAHSRLNSWAVMVGRKWRF